VTPDRRLSGERRRLGFISGAKIFEGVPYAALEAALQPLTIQDIAGETVLLKPGDANHSVLLVLRGELRIFLDRPGQGDFIEAGVGDCVGEMSVIDDQPVSAYVVALKGSRLLVIDGDTFLNRLMAIPRVSRNLMSAMSERMRRSDRLTIQRMRKLLEMEQAQRELQYARTIQESQLPRAPLFSDDARLDCVGRMCAAREVGGDFYDIFFLDARHLFFVVADVCGKGLPAAMFMVRAMAVLRAQSGHQVLTESYLENLVASLNEDLCAYNAAQQFLTAFCGVLDLETNILRYVNAGHNPPAMGGADGMFRFTGAPVCPLVGMISGLNFRAGEIELAPGGTIVLYTDGVTEAENEHGGMLGEARLLACLDASSGATAAQLVEALFDDVRQFAGSAAQSDDITVLVVRRPVG
jgi:serine phosphatase RsbU (regulator of sigma subunit)